MIRDRNPLFANDNNTIALFNFDGENLVNQAIGKSKFLFPDMTIPDISPNPIFSINAPLSTGGNRRSLGILGDNGFSVTSIIQDPDKEFFNNAHHLSFWMYYPENPDTDGVVMSMDGGDQRTSFLGFIFDEGKLKEYIMNSIYGNTIYDTFTDTQTDSMKGKWNNIKTFFYRTSNNLQRVIQINNDIYVESQQGWVQSSIFSDTVNITYNQRLVYNQDKARPPCQVSNIILKENITLAQFRCYKHLNQNRTMVQGTTSTFDDRYINVRNTVTGDSRVFSNLERTDGTLESWANGDNIDTVAIFDNASLVQTNTALQPRYNYTDKTLDFTATVVERMQLAIPDIVNLGFEIEFVKGVNTNTFEWFYSKRQARGTDYCFSLSKDTAQKIRIQIVDSNQNVYIITGSNAVLETSIYNIEVTVINEVLRMVITKDGIVDEDLTLPLPVGFVLNNSYGYCSLPQQWQASGFYYPNMSVRKLRQFDSVTGVDYFNMDLTT